MSILREAAEQLFTLWVAQKTRIDSVAAELDLSPAQACTLLRMVPGESVAMSALAGTMACDPSNVTGIVDKLEARGLVARRPAEHDRRIKLLILSEDGALLRDQLLDRLREPPPWMGQLSRDEQRQLRDLLRRCSELAGVR